MAVRLKVTRPHKGQKHILLNRERFNYVNCGRRFGKTTLGVYLGTESTEILSQPFGWYSPSYKSLNEVWKKFKQRLGPLIKNKSEQLKQLELYTGGTFDFWSLDDPDASRGRKYKRVVIDEGAMIRKLKIAVRETILATLIDLQGDLYAFSTPKGKGNDWFSMCQDAKTQKDSAFFQMPTWENPYIDKGEIEIIKNVTPELEFRQEYGAEFIDFTEDGFFDCFKETEQTVDSIEIDYSIPLTISFDFNYNPCSVVIGQKIWGVGLNYLANYQEPGGTEKLLHTHLKWLRDLTLSGEVGLEITGDNNGHRNESSAGGATDFGHIETFFQRPVDDITFTANGLHHHSRKICNHTLLKANPRFSKEGCSELIREMAMAQADTKGNLSKKPDLHLVDAYRYMNNLWFETIDEINAFMLSIQEREEFIKYRAKQDKEYRAKQAAKFDKYKFK